jgi:uroporphyrinogen III methyltransferase/synthase
VTRPLAGRTVVVTRPAEQAPPLVRALERRGARVLVAPTIRLVPARSVALTRALRELANGDFAWITLTSAATVDVLRERLSSPADVRARVAAIGEGTAAAFARWARRDADLQPATFTTTALARAFPRGAGRVLCARADVAPEGLEEALARKGWQPTRVDAYRTVFARSLPREVRAALAHDEVDAVTFTSASTVRGFARLVNPPRRSFVAVCIGPVTAREARGHGFAVGRVARPHTIDALAEAVEAALARIARGTLRR